MRPTPRTLLEQANQPFLLVSNLTNIRYLTGMQLSDGLLLVTPRSFVLFLDGRYTEAAMQEVLPGVLVRPIVSLEKSLAKVAECGFEEEHVTVAELRKWKQKFSATKFVRTQDSVEAFRRTKSDDELKFLRRAHRITEEMLRRVPAALRKGITEKALAWKLQTWARELGGDGVSFDPIVAFGTHSSRPHHHPTTRALQKGHLVQIDVGAVYRGYAADLSQVFFTDDPTPLQRDVLQAVTDAKDAAIDAIVAGASTREIDALARKVITQKGFEPFPHALGHAVGLDVHESPVLSPRYPNAQLQAGEVLAIEPAIYLPGKFGMRLEEMVIVA